MTENNKATIKAGTMAPIENPAVDTAIQNLKAGASPETQAALSAALASARLLAPCQFDVPFEQDENGNLPQNVHPNQIKFFLVNTKDGRSFFPAFTDVNKTLKMSFTQEKKALQVVRTVKDFDILLSQPGNKAAGIVLNPGTDDIIVPANMIARLNGRDPQKAVPVNPVRSAPVQATFSEPSVYPTRMVNAIYDRCLNVKEISRVYLKQKTAARAASFFIVVESDVQEERVLNEIREVAVPLAKDIPVEVVFANPQIMKIVIKESTALYDRELEL